MNPKVRLGALGAAFLLIFGCSDFNPTSPQTISLTKYNSSGQGFVKVSSHQAQVNVTLRNDGDMTADSLDVEVGFVYGGSPGTTVYITKSYNKSLKPGNSAEVSFTYYDTDAAFSGGYSFDSSLTSVKISSVSVWNYQQNASKAVYVNNYTGQQGSLYP